MSIMLRSSSGTAQSVRTGGNGRSDRGYKYLRFVGPIAAAGIWEALVETNVVNGLIIPAPSSIFGTAASMFHTGHLLNQIGDTLYLFILGFAIGTFCGLVIGMAMGLWRVADYLFRPLISLFFPLPLIALIPLILILVGENQRAFVLMIFFGPFFTMSITTWGAVSNIPTIYHEVGRSFRVSALQRYFLIVFPAALEGIITGLRIATGAAYLGTIAVEFLAAQNGIGYVIWNSWQVLNVRASMVALVVATLLGFLLFTSVSWIQRILMPWKPRPT